MPHLLNFIRGNGTLLTNDHTVLISHTATGILSTLTGVYRTGLNNAEFHGQSLSEHQINDWIVAADALLAQAHDLAESS